MIALKLSFVNNFFVRQNSALRRGAVSVGTYNIILFYHREGIRFRAEDNNAKRGGIMPRSYRIYKALTYRT